jgi:hypothetical protein
LLLGISQFASEKSYFFNRWQQSRTIQHNGAKRRADMNTLALVSRLEVRDSDPERLSREHSPNDARFWTNSDRARAHRAAHLLKPKYSI